MVIVSVGHTLLRADVLAKRRVEHGTLEVVRGERVTAGVRVDVALLHQPLHGMAGVRIKGKRQSHHSFDKPVDRVRTSTAR